MQDEIHKLTKCPDFIITNKSCLEKKEILTEEDQEKKDLKLLHQITNQTFQPSELKKDLTNFVESIKSLNILPIFQLGKIVNIKNNVSQTLYESRIKSLEGRVDKIEEILKQHQNAILDLTGEVNEMKKQMNEVLERIKKIEDRMEKCERVNIQNKADKIIDYLDKMNDNGLYELANFILQLRNMERPFNLDHIMNGIKMILEKNPKQ